MFLITKLLSLNLPLQTYILKYIPDIKVIFLLELYKKQKKNINIIECEIKRKIKKLKTNNDSLEKYIYNSCLHTNYNTERWNDYHHNFTHKRCILCNQVLHGNHGINEIEYKWVS